MRVGQVREGEHGQIMPVPQRRIQIKNFPMQSGIVAP
jgi:hypothetical protein